MGLLSLLGSDSGVDLALFSEIGLVISLIVFAMIVLRTFSRRSTREQEEASRLPLEDDTNDLRGTR